MSDIISMVSVLRNMHPGREVYSGSVTVVKQMNRYGSDLRHTCGAFCLGPLAFHTEAVGDRITLTHRSRRAERSCDTFRNGLVFSDRPVRVGEKVRLRVDRNACRWHGALRLGFTTVPPGHGPQADMAIPDLTQKRGYWAAPVPEIHTLPGYELQFWVSAKGKLLYRGPDGQNYKLLVGMDISKPLWAMVDVYGQTCAVALLGSRKKCLLGTRTSCPNLAPPPALETAVFVLGNEGPGLHRLNCVRTSTSIADDQWTEDFSTQESCVVCMSRTARVILRCGHQCLCTQCAKRVKTDFGTCPLCRHPIT